MNLGSSGDTLIPYNPASFINPPVSVLSGSVITRYLLRPAYLSSITSRSSSPVILAYCME
jgi:hypothetical protein